MGASDEMRDNAARDRRQRGPASTREARFAINCWLYARRSGADA
jgi:hypothetical protein